MPKLGEETMEPCLQASAIDVLTVLFKDTLKGINSLTAQLQTMAVTENNVRHLDKEQKSQWSKIDEAADLARKALEAATVASSAATAAAEAATHAAEVACAANKKVQKLAATPGALALRGVGIAIMSVMSALIGVYFGKA